MNAETAGKIILFSGLAIAALGGGLWLLAKAGFKGLPGDISIQRGNWSFNFPVVTCIVISILATIVLNLWNRK